MSEKKKYFWKDDADIGSYDFCYNEAGDYDFYINEVAVHYNRGWTEEERQRRFKGAKFVWGGCAGGVSYSNKPLEADNIEDAKKEFEAWYEQYLADCIENLKKRMEAITKEYEVFLAYKEGDHYSSDN